MQHPIHPAVAAATTAAMGAPTPAPCAPNLASPWAPGATKVMVEGMPAVLKSYTLSCMWGGVIEVTNPGQTKVQAK